MNLSIIVLLNDVKDIKLQTQGEKNLPKILNLCAPTILLFFSF